MSSERMAQRSVPLATPFGRLARGPRLSRGVGLSAALHLGAIALLVWGGMEVVEAGRMPGSGRGRGGGGGGGNRVLMFFTIAAPPPAPAPPAPALVVPTSAPQPLPEVKLPEQPTHAAAADSAAQASGPGQGAGQGAGAGRGAGTGGGAGSGVGPGIGPDSGGGGGRIYPPQPQGIILPPPDRPAALRGTTVTVHFDISERGEVLEITVEPPIRDRRFRADFLERMRRYTFTPAYTLDGRPVRAIYPVRITL